MLKLKKLCLVAVLTALLLCGFGTLTYANGIDDALNDTLTPGTVVTLGRYNNVDLNWVYMGNYYFVMRKDSFEAMNLTKAYNDTAASVTWKNSTLYSWLNSTFYNTAFSAVNNKNQILEVTLPIHNDINRLDSFGVGENITKKITYYYGGIYGGFSTVDAYYTMSWWTSSDANSSSQAFFVNGTNRQGDWQSVDTAYGIRPAFHLKAIVAGSKNFNNATYGDINIGDVVDFGTYPDLRGNSIGLQWRYMGDSYFILDRKSFHNINITKQFDGTGGHLMWYNSDLKNWLNNSTNGFIKTAFNNDSRIAYVTIPTLSDYEEMQCMYNTFTYYNNWWLRSSYVDDYTTYIYSINGDTGSIDRMNSAGYTKNVLPAFKLKKEIGQDNSSVFTVVQAQPFSVVLKGELGTTTVSSVTATSTSGSGYTVLTGTTTTFTTSGIQKVTINGKELIFNVISAPTVSTTAKVNFGV